MEEPPWPKHELWKYIVMPFMSAIVGWFTNVLALEMTFYPIEYFGVEWLRLEDQPWGFFGWQGIIPTKAAKMADTVAQLSTKKLFSVQDMFKRIDPDAFYKAAEPGLVPLIENVIEETALEHMPTAWQYLPKTMKNELLITTKKECPAFIGAFIADMLINIDSILDVRKMTVAVCVQNKEKVNKVFQECGKEEFNFIRRSGFLFGFIFGSLQAVLYLYYDGKWLLPVFGFLVGWFTNYVALRVIFRPIIPRKICGNFYIQGLFLKRQVEVSSIYARVNCEEVLTTKAMWNFILNGPDRINFQTLLRAHSIVFTEKLVGGLRPFAIATLGVEGFATMKEAVAEKVIEAMPIIMPLTYDYTTKALDLENTIRKSMQALPPSEFESVLHPAFEEDEMTLIFVGGVLDSIFRLESEGKGYFSAKDEKILGQDAIDGDKVNVTSVRKTINNYIEAINSAGFQILDVKDVDEKEEHLKINKAFFETVKDRALHLIFKLKKMKT